MTLEQTRDFVTNMLEARSHILQNPEYGGTEIDFWADRIKDFIDATLLAQHAVAEPVDMLTELDHVKYTGPAGKIMQPKTRLFKCPSCGKEFRDIAHAPNGILCPDCPPVPAAEQPKLTPSVWTITEEAAKHSHFCYHKDSDEWKCSCGETLSKYVIPYDERRKLNSLDSEMGFVRFN